MSFLGRGGRAPRPAAQGAASGAVGARSAGTATKACDHYSYTHFRGSRGYYFAWRGFRAPSLAWSGSLAVATSSCTGREFRKVFKVDGKFMINNLGAFKDFWGRLQAPRSPERLLYGP